MHTWKPDAYSEAPIPGAAMLATGVLNCALYGLVRFYILSSKCLGPQFGSHLLILFGLLSIGVAVPFILVQKNFRRLLAYSSIDHSGIMVLALGFGGPLGMLGMLLHMTFHSITKPLLFFCAGNVQQELKTDLFRKTKGGLIHSMPLTGAAFLMVTLAVTGSPPFSFFQSEFTILRASFSAGYFTLAAIFTGFLVTIFSGFLVHIANLVLGENPGLARTDMCGWKKYSVVGLAAVIIIMGFWIPAPLFRLIQRQRTSGGEAMTRPMSPLFEALQQKFGAQIQSITADREDETYLILSDPEIRPITNHLRAEFGARLVMVFAEDRRSQEGVFFNYYVFEQKGSSRYLIVRAPIRPDALGFPSLSAELPAVNWQEREIQDWFGLKAVGHPNPRRVALHDNWPDVHPLRKDFPIETVLPPFEGERHIYRPALGEGVFQVPVGPVHAGIIEPGHFNFAVAGEPILYLQLRMFYTHKGTEKLFEKLPDTQGRLSG